LEGADLASQLCLVAGDVFGPPFEARTFDLVYSAGLFHELDVRERAAEDALAALVSVTRPGGRISTSDFVASAPAVQLEDEAFEAELARETSGKEPYGIGSPERLVALHERSRDCANAASSSCNGSGARATPVRPRSMSKGGCRTGSSLAAARPPSIEMHCRIGAGTTI
jgi:SAM-dependent methyltransferase